MDTYNEMIEMTTISELFVVIYKDDVPARREAISQRQLTEKIRKKKDHSNIALKDSQ